MDEQDEPGQDERCGPPSCGALSPIRSDRVDLPVSFLFLVVSHAVAQLSNGPRRQGCAPGRDTGTLKPLRCRAPHGHDQTWENVQFSPFFRPAAAAGRRLVDLRQRRRWACAPISVIYATSGFLHACVRPPNEMIAIFALALISPLLFISSVVTSSPV